ncbi:MAG TPA: CHAT domain-containing protein, partial [Nitriliruptoraceae bacterium]|nr:CHAT domain-containing protein [Nitriliruptoraceae bacterium]
MDGQSHRVVVVDGADWMVRAVTAIRDGGADVVAVRHLGEDGATTWTVWRSEDLLSPPLSLHESGLRHVGSLLSLAGRPGIETWPEGDEAPHDRAVLVVADGTPVALVLPASDPDGSTVFETHVPLPPDLPTDPTPGSDDAADAGADGDGGDDGDHADDGGDADDGGGWWTRQPSEPTGPVRGGGDWATASPPPTAPAAPPTARPTPGARPPMPESASPPRPASPPPASAPPPPSSTPTPTVPPSTSGSEPTPPASSGAPPPPPTTATPPPVGTEPEAPPTTTTLHPFLDAPDRVDSGASITVMVGVGARAQPGLTTSGDGMVVEVDDQGEAVFDVMIVAQGFTVHGARDQLRVAATAPDKKRLAITLDADEVTEVTRTIIEVQYGQAGTPIGRAWREIVIAPAGAAVTGDVRSGALPVTTGGQPAADLTVMAVAGQDDKTMLWTFFSPHDIELPDQAAAWTLTAASARDLALQQVLKMAKATSSPLSDNEMRGLATVVADAMPPTFWKVLAGVATATTSEDRRPSLLLVTEEPWVPWELAATSADYLPPELVDPAAPAFLGAQFAMGRWLVPRERGLVESPTLPPPTTHDVEGMALVVGDYAASINWRTLPEAQAEGDALAQRYRASRWTATAPDMDRLLDNDLDGEPGDVLHMACHGAVDPDNLQWSGIILSEDEDRLSPLMIRGSTFPREQRPMVFLNACQVGQGTDGMSDSGSLGAAFIRGGATGFVAPLW